MEVQVSEASQALNFASYVYSMQNEGIVGLFWETDSDNETIKNIAFQFYFLFELGCDGFKSDRQVKDSLR